MSAEIAVSAFVEANASRTVVGREVPGDGGPLFERRDALECVGAAVARAAAGTGSLLVVEGSAGVGKSAFLSAAAASATGSGARTLRARGRDPDRTIEFHVVRELLGGALAGAGPDELARLLEGPAAPAAEVLERPRRRLQGKHIVRQIHGVYWLIRRVTSTGPLFITVDDAHWGDPASLRVLVHLAERLQELPVAMLVALARVPGPRSRVLRQLVDNPSAQRVALEPLSRDGVTELALLHGVRDEAFVDVCLRATAGNPFLLAELMRDLAGRRLPPTARTARLVVKAAPSTVIRAASRSIDQLPDPCGKLAQAVAVLGNEAPLRLAADLAGLELELAGRAAETLASMEVLASGVTLEFRQPLLRSAVYAAMSPTRRSLLHLRAAQLELRDGAPAPRVSAQLLAAAPSGKAWVVEQLVKGARRALASGSPERAVRLLRRALDEPPEGRTRVSVLVALAEAEATIGAVTCVDRLGQAMAMVAEPRAHAMIAIRMSAMLVEQGRRREACALLRGTLDGVPAGDRNLTEDVVIAYVSAALLDAQSAPDARRRLRLLDMRCDRSQRRQRALLSAIHLDETLATRPMLDGGALVAGDLEVWHDRRAWMAGPEPWQTIDRLIWCDELVRAERACSAVLAAATAQGLAVGHARARGARAAVRYLSGQLEAATDDACAAWDGGCARPSSWRQESAGWLCLCRLERDETDAAAEVIAQFEAGGYRASDEPGAGVLAIAMARMALYDGRGALALELLEETGAALAPIMSNPAVVPWRSEAAVAAAWTGEHARARELAAEELELARRWGAPRAIGVALRAAGLVTGGAAGIELLEESVRVLEHSPAALERARALAALGGKLRREGYRRDARDVLRAALVLCERAGARRLQRIVRDDLATAGARPRRDSCTGPAALTPGELRVANLAAQGLTNRQIAGELVVTDKAIQWHLRHVYRKLGVSRRQDLARSLAQ